MTRMMDNQANRSYRDEPNKNRNKIRYDSVQGNPYSLGALHTMMLPHPKRGHRDRNVGMFTIAAGTIAVLSLFLITFVSIQVLLDPNQLSSNPTHVYSTVGGDDFVTDLQYDEFIELDDFSQNTEQLLHLFDDVLDFGVNDTDDDLLLSHSPTLVPSTWVPTSISESDDEVPSLQDPSTGGPTTVASPTIKPSTPFPVWDNTNVPTVWESSNVPTETDLFSNAWEPTGADAIVAEIEAEIEAVNFDNLDAYSNFGDPQGQLAPNDVLDTDPTAEAVDTIGQSTTVDAIDKTTNLGEPQDQVSPDAAEVWYAEGKIDLSQEGVAQISTIDKTNDNINLGEQQEQLASNVIPDPVAAEIIAQITTVVNDETASFGEPQGQLSPTVAGPDPITAEERIIPNGGFAVTPTDGIEAENLSTTSSTSIVPSRPIVPNDNEIIEDQTQYFADPLLSPISSMTTAEETVVLDSTSTSSINPSDGFVDDGGPHFTDDADDTAVFAFDNVNGASGSEQYDDDTQPLLLGEFGGSAFTQNSFGANTASTKDADFAIFIDD